MVKSNRLEGHKSRHQGHTEADWMNMGIFIDSSPGNSYLLYRTISLPLSRRTTLDVMADILRIASRPTSRTQILYAANLSYSQTVKYVEMMIACGMLSKVSEKGGRQKGGTVKFVITDSGQGFLTQISQHFGSISPGERSVWN